MPVSIDSTQPLEVLVIGGASLDVLHLANGQTAHSPGGAGLYTALAAHCSGVRTGMFAPRPEPMPQQLQPAADRLVWLGPLVSPDQLPSFEIAHHGQGRATLVKAAWGGEMLITPDLLLRDQIKTAIIHIAALRSAERQLNFAKALKSLAKDFAPTDFPHGPPRLSAGTYGKICAGEPDTVRALIDLCDVFFMNENEANLLFGRVEAVQARPDQMIFITLDARGALVLQGQHLTAVDAVHALEVDPTGAGDTFCGATLAGLARGEHPVMAARSAVTLAAEMIGEIGPARLLSDRPAPGPTINRRVQLVPDQIRRTAELIAQLPDIQPFDFTGDLFPPIDHPQALDTFFAATLQQFGFWEMQQINRKGTESTEFPKLFSVLCPFPPQCSGGPPGAVPAWFYDRPMIATLDGKSLKGSDYLWAAYRRALDRHAEFCTPTRQAALTEDDLIEVFRADDGHQPMPAFELHLQQAQAYGRDMQALHWTPRQILAAANRSHQPRQTFLSMLDHVGGYTEDPLRKKSMLLALILEQRPERFLRPALHETAPPVIDYHLMRSCLRIGLIDIHDEALWQHVIQRAEISAEDEWAVRYAAYQAIQQVQQQAGRSMGAVDWFFFNARRRCPEMTEPDCPRCPVDPICAHRKELFQPVRRTTFY